MTRRLRTPSVPGYPLLPFARSEYLPDALNASAFDEDRLQLIGTLDLACIADLRSALCSLGVGPPPLTGVPRACPEAGLTECILPDKVLRTFPAHIWE